MRILVELQEKSKVRVVVDNFEYDLPPGTTLTHDVATNSLVIALPGAPPMRALPQPEFDQLTSLIGKKLPVKKAVKDTLDRRWRQVAPDKIQYWYKRTLLALEKYGEPMNARSLIQALTLGKRVEDSERKMLQRVLKAMGEDGTLHTYHRHAHAQAVYSLPKDHKKSQAAQASLPIEEEEVA